MKKLLSILSIGTILASTLPTLVACNSSNPPNPKTKLALALNNLQIFNINVTKNNNNLLIDGQSAYKEVEFEIIDEYKTIFPKTKLSINDFESNSTKLQNNKSWAVQIYNIDGTSPIADAKNQALVFPKNYTCLQDNALKVKITTNDKNVFDNSKNDSSNLFEATIKAYLNKFIYTNKNANKNHAITSDDHKSAAENNLTKENAIDMSAPGKASAISLHNGQIITITLNANQQKALYEEIISNFNTQLKNETKTLNDLGFLTQASSKGSITLNQTNTAFILAPPYGGITVIRSFKGILPPGTPNGFPVFARVTLPISQYNYIPLQDKCVFLYLGTTQK